MAARPKVSMRWLAALLVVVLGAGMATSPTVFAANDGRISGTVAEEGTGVPLGGVYVEARRLVAGEWTFAGSATTRQDGGYDLEALAAGDYRLVFDPDDGAHLFEWFHDKLHLEEADVISVTSTPFVNADAALAVSGQIEGAVTSAGSAGLADVSVLLLELGESGAWEYVESSSTNPQGKYVLGRVRPGVYRLQLDGTEAGYLNEFWDDAASIEAGQDIGVASGATVTKDADLEALSPDRHVIAGSPKVTGTAQVGSLLTAHEGAWAPFDVSFTYQWLANDLPVQGATSSTFTPSASEAGTVITVRVTGSKLGFTSSSAMSAGTAPVVTATAPGVVNTAPPTISGDPKVGSTLTASAGSWTPAGVTHIYEWLSGGVVVAQGASPTLMVPVSLIGRTLSVRVTAAAPGHTPTSAVSAESAAVVPGTITSRPRARLKGKAAVLGVLILEPGTFTPSGARLSFSWFANGKRIKGVQGKKLPLGRAYLGSVITAKVTARLVGYAPLKVRTAGKIVKPTKATR